MRGEKSLLWSLLSLLVYTSWARGGVYGPWHVGIWLFVAILFVTGVVVLSQVSREHRIDFFLDPLFFIGTVLSLLLVIQWRNSGGQLFVNMFTGTYNYTAPPMEGWPFSIEARLSRQQLLWFVPLTMMLPMVRHLLGTASRKILLRGMLLNAVALALFGLVQFVLGWTKMFGFVPIEQNPPLISTFEYTNHGGAFFYLLMAVAIGFGWDALEKRKPVWWWIGLGLAGVLFAITAFCSLSRAAAVAVIGIAVFTLTAALWSRRKSIKPMHWINIGLATAVMLVMLVVGMVSVGDGAVLKEFSATSVVESDLQNYQETRGFQIPPALNMVKDFPWFGVGGWGYRKYVPLYMPADQWHKLGTGKANVHCDPVQFLAEHGVVGFGLMNAALAVVLWPWRHFAQWRFQKPALMTAFGAGLICLHSLVDLPFRNPTVLWHWLLLLVLVPLLAERHLKRRDDVTK